MDFQEKILTEPQGALGIVPFLLYLSEFPNYFMLRNIRQKLSVTRFLEIKYIVCIMDAHIYKSGGHFSALITDIGSAGTS